MLFGAGFWAQEHYLKTAVSVPPAAPPETATIDPKVVSAIQARVAKSGADVGIASETLDGQLAWFSRADDEFHAASTMKIPVMIELFQQMREGKVKITDSVPIKN